MLCADCPLEFTFLNELEMENAITNIFGDFPTILEFVQVSNYPYHLPSF